MNQEPNQEHVTEHKVADLDTAATVDEEQSLKHHLPFVFGIVAALLLIFLPIVGYMLLMSSDGEESKQQSQVRQNVQAEVSLQEMPPLETYDRYAKFSFTATVPVECRLNDGKYELCSEELFLPETKEGANTFTVRTVANKQQLASHTWEVLDVFDMDTPDLLVSNQTPSKAEPRSWRGIIRINCDFSHSSYNDPIVFPGEEGMAHLHRFYGNELLDHTTTLESLLTTGSSTCQGNNLNRSAYWIPALLAPLYNQQTKERQLDENGDPAWQAVPAVVGNNEEAHEVFYYSAGIDDLEAIQPIPVGLRMIAGEAATKPGREQDTSIVRWHCQSWESTDAGNPRWSTTIPECQAPDRVRMDVFFPSCWNGRDLDSADHKSHMAYPVRDSVSGDMVCPSSHPVAIVRPSYHYAFGVLPNAYDPETKSSRGWKVASDDYEVTDTQAGGLSLHGDWFNGWHPTIMEAMLETCIQERFDCHNGNLANGWRLADVYPGVQNDPPIYNAGAGLHGAMSHSDIETSTEDIIEPTANERQRPEKEKPTRN